MPIIPESRQFDQWIMRLLLEQVLSTYLFLLMSFPHLEALLAFFMLILHEKGRKNVLLPHFSGEIISSLH